MTQHYKVNCLSCGRDIDESTMPLSCPNCSDPHFIRAEYKKTTLEPGPEDQGLYRFSDWLPISRQLEGSGAPISYKSEALAAELDMTNLWITFNGWWPERGAKMKTGAFKECEAYSVCGRIDPAQKGSLVVASAGNTARAFAHVCSENKIPLVISIPEDNISALWFKEPLNDCVKIIAPPKGSDYFDAIALAGKLCQGENFFPEGGAKNIARRDGMGTTVLSAVHEMQEIPDYYFQAVGSGTGAIAAWEMNQRLIADGRFGNKKMKLMVSQNRPFTIIYDSWKADSRGLVDLDDQLARDQIQEISAKVLSNRKPPYSLNNGLFDALKDSEGDVLLASNEEASQAKELFETLEGIDISDAAAVACATLISAVKEGSLPKDAAVMLNITGGGMERFKKDHKTVQATPHLILDPAMTAQQIVEEVEKLYS